jgi:hypothetical protein
VVSAVRVISSLANKNLGADAAPRSTVPPLKVPLKATLVTVPLIVDKIIKHYITELHIEQNAGGKLLTDSIKTEMSRRDVRFCRIVPYYASTKMPKDEKIKAYSDWIKENFMFLMPNGAISMLDDVEYKRSDQYQKAMDELSMYASEGKNPHDDAPDALSQFAIILGKKARQTVVWQGFL